MKGYELRIYKGSGGVAEGSCRGYETNAREIIGAAEAAASRGVKLLVTPELGVTAYTCGDLFLQRRLITAADAAVGEIAAATAGLDMLLVIGAPVRRGASLFNCALVVYHGEVLGAVPKTNIPNYGEFYELRHFTPAPECGGTIVVAVKRCRFGTDLVFSCREMPEFRSGARYARISGFPRRRRSDLPRRGR